MILLHEMQRSSGQDAKSLWHKLKVIECLQVVHETLESKMNAHQAKTEAKHNR
jgi:hypothetical protein